MIKKALRIATLLMTVLIAAGLVLYVRNAAPVVPVVSAAEAALRWRDAGRDTDSYADECFATTD